MNKVKKLIHFKKKDMIKKLYLLLLLVKLSEKNINNYEKY